MKIVKLATAVILGLGFVMNAHAALMAPFADLNVNAGQRVYVYYGLVPGITNKMICKANSNGHMFSWVKDPFGLAQTDTRDEVALTPSNAGKSGVMIFDSGTTNDKLSCEYTQG